MKRNKGITLIALIITIILLLILLGVSTNIVIKKDLFGSAKKAVNGTNAKVKDQQTRVDELMEELDKVEKENSSHDWQYVNAKTREQIRCTCAMCKAFEDGDSTGRTLNVGQQIGATESRTASTRITAGKSGYDTDQTLALNAEETKWVVFGFEDKNGDNKNEILLLTTEHPTKNKIWFEGAASYNNCIEELNRMCKELYGENARGMTIEDVNKVFGYTPAGMYCLNSKYNTTGNLTTKLKDLGEMWTAITDYNTNNKGGVFYDPSNPEGIKDNGEVLGKYTLDGYLYYLSSDGTYLANNADTTDTSHKISTTLKKIIFGNKGKNYGYWLASRGVYAESYYAGFGPDYVGGGLVFSCSGLFNSSGDTRFDEFSVRALVSLNSEIPAGGAVLDFSGWFGVVEPN